MHLPGILLEANEVWITQAVQFLAELVPLVTFSVIKQSLCTTKTISRWPGEARL